MDVALVDAVEMVGQTRVRALPSAAHDPTTAGSAAWTARSWGRSALEAALRAFLEASFALGDAQRLAPVLRALMAEAQHDPAFAEAFRTGFVERRRDAARRLLARARRRGELARGTDPEVLVDLVFGALWYRLLVGQAPLDAAFARALARAVARAAG